MRLALGGMRLALGGMRLALGGMRRSASCPQCGEFPILELIWGKLFLLCKLRVPIR
jgi:hypothetical protein